LLEVFEVYEFKNKKAILLKNIAQNIFLDKITSIEESESVVYDFTVPETHSFVANGIVNHNTFTLKGFTETLKLQGKSYMSCALSGKAAKVLSSKGLNSSTIHRMLGAIG